MATAKKRTTERAAPKPAAGPAKRLDRYRSMRDFDVTPEPSGSTPPAETGNRFVVQRHRARRLHYDLRLEMDGVLVSWAVPKGPTRDPKARRLAVHVEDHPLDYFDFEGVIPEHEYGGGDVIVWDWGTWTQAKGDDPVRAVEQGELHFDLAGEKLAGRFVLVRRDDKPAGKEQWLLLHKSDDEAVPGWDAEEHPASVKSGRTNDEVAADPAATWHSNRAEAPAPGPAPPLPTWEGPTDHELAALDELGKAGPWELGGRTLKLTNLDKVLFPAGAGGKPVTKRDLVRYYATVAPAMLPYLYDRPINMRRHPDGVEKPGFWHKAAPDHAPEWIPRWRNEEADPGETECYLVLDSPAALAWAANYAGVELNPWTSTIADSHQPTWAMIDVDPGTSSSFDDVVVLTRLYRTAIEHLGVQAAAKVTGKRGIQVWVPVADGYGFDDTRAWVEKVSRAIGATVPDMVSWEWEKSKRGGKARLDYTQNAINKTLVAPFSTRPVAGAPVSMPIHWHELDDDALRPDRWTIRDACDRLAEAGDPLRPLVGLQQPLPTL
jgi:bifunctional non-homologous end joining protein LigD